MNAIRGKPGRYKLMTEDTIVMVSLQLANMIPRGRIAFAVHGEPTMHSDIHAVIGIARTLLPDVQFTLVTNGRALMGRMQCKLERLFRAGIDIVLLDTYLPERDDLQAEALSLRPPITVRDLHRDVIPSRFGVWANHRRKVRNLVILQDDLSLWNGKHRSRVINNHAGGSLAKPAMKAPLARSCTKPFRELTVLWDGEVAFCCEDFPQRLMMGNVFRTELRQIWFGPAFEAGRTLLQNRLRDFGSCRYCDSGGGGRKGLLPVYGPVTDDHRRVLEEQERYTRPRFELLRVEKEKDLAGRR
jgi:MoaA/NifB/PqqE/SkfB family radical SAM enzyme